VQPTALAGVYDAASEADSQATEGQNERNQPCACVSAPAFMLLLGSGPHQELATGRRRQTDCLYTAAPAFHCIGWRLRRAAVSGGREHDRSRTVLLSSCQTRPVSRWARSRLRPALFVTHAERQRAVCEKQPLALLQQSCASPPTAHPHRARCRRRDGATWVRYFDLIDSSFILSDFI
jgi:hypothetical protein